MWNPRTKNHCERIWRCRVTLQSGCERVWAWGNESCEQQKGCEESEETFTDRVENNQYIRAAITANVEKMTRKTYQLHSGLEFHTYYRWQLPYSTYALYLLRLLMYSRDYLICRWIPWLLFHLLGWWWKRLNMYASFWRKKTNMCCF